MRILNLFFSKNEVEKIYLYVDGFRGFYFFVYFEVVWGGGGVKRVVICIFDFKMFRILFI